MGESAGDPDISENQVTAGDSGARGEGEEREGGGETHNGVGGNNLKSGNDIKKGVCRRGRGIQIGSLE